MRKPAVLYLMMTLTLPLSARAGSTRVEDINRIEHSIEIFDEIMGAPDKAIPQDLLVAAKCIAIIPAEKKFAILIGGNYGKGLVTCRGDKGWSAPLFLGVSGMSYGFQFGGTSADYILVFLKRRGLDELLGRKFKIGADVSAAAGPVGRTAAVDTGIGLHAEILTYSRTRGVFGGFSLSGAMMELDRSGNKAFYGRTANKENILDGKVNVPQDARELVEAVSKATRTPAAPTAPPPADNKSL